MHSMSSRRRIGEWHEWKFQSQVSISMWTTIPRIRRVENVAERAAHCAVKTELNLNKECAAIWYVNIYIVFFLNRIFLRSVHRSFIIFFIKY